ncbi:MAG: tyrosine-type recombinase/integrase [Beijerinckiaceae bacterium]|nr:tyrosine-type recombinase/integrase [Beijerinckiaceae bacterium]
MTRIKLKGFQIFRDRHGRWRCYHRAARTAVDLGKTPLGSAEFFAECEKIAALAGAKGLKAKPGTLGLLISDYRASPAFQDLAPQTKADYQRIFDYLQPIADVALVRFDRPLVVRIRDKAAATRNRRFANYVKAVLSLVFAWGGQRGYIITNPAAGIKDIRRQKGAPEANRPWSDEERDAVLTAAPAHMRPALALMMFTGLGPKDALTLPRNHWREGEIATRRSKTSEPVFWPVPGPLAAILHAAPAHPATTLCASSTGRPWTLDGFRASWRTLRIKLEKAGAIGRGLTLYGLRHTVAVILREAGHDERTIADALGQRTIEMARHYAKSADLRGKMRGVVKSFDEELAKRRTRVVKPG